MQKKLLEVFFRNRIAIGALIIVGSLSWSLVMIKSGIIYAYGMGFWGPNGHDGVWHVALAESFKRGNFGMPVFAGAPLKNYHIGFDLLLAAVSKVTFIPVANLYFQIIPVVLSLAIGTLTYKFVELWTKSRKQAFWATFFVYFGGNFGWILTLAKNGQVSGESLFWSQQSVSTLVNPPFALSVGLMILGMIMLQKKRLFWSVLAFGLLIQIKVYAGVLGLGALFTAGAYDYFKNSEFFYLKVFSFAFVISAVLFIPFNRTSGSLVVFQPFWFLETMMGLSDRVGWTRFGEAMVNYKTGGVWGKAALSYSVAFLIFFVGNLGTRAIGLVWFTKKAENLKSLQPIEVFMGSLIGGGILAPMLFLQEGTPWNTIQFFYYSLIFMGILSGIVFSKFSRVSLVVVILFLTLPTTLGTLFNSYLPGRPPARLSVMEIEALEFLAERPGGVVLTYPFERASSEPPVELYKYESTAYVAAFGGHEVFLEDEVNLNITGYDWPSRRQEILDFYETLDIEKAREFLKKSDIDYVYWVKPQRARLGETQLRIARVFENEEVDIYQVIQ